MSAVFNDALNSIKNLSNNEKAILAHCLISDLDSKLDNNIEQAWAQLAQQRFEELQSGKVTSISWDDIKQSVIA